MVLRCFGARGRDDGMSCSRPRELPNSRFAFATIDKWRPNEPA
ncbi:hypothetical protein AKJ09_02489 [Labilithrix luteola]|uniref:Uncharacterized protein n=1 Tax=Labilithrix luteola TaxID=1391654 RepID=A0A0K1PQK9_9BACT|nr:hypothetical protein AKJ09_02489 [Labilithrix luteola]